MKHYMTHSRRVKIMQAKVMIVLTLLTILFFYLLGVSQQTLDEIEKLTEVNIPIVKAKQIKKDNKVISQAIRVATAYNLGDRKQTDNSPCIGAYTKVNLCKEVAKGTNVCAANFVPLGTKLLIEAPTGWTFQCIVWDRLSKRYPNRVDIAMNYWEHKRAVKFGKQKLLVKILKK